MAFTVASLGMLVGSIVASTWGGPKKRVLGLVLGGAFLGVVFATVGLKASVFWITGVMFLGMLWIPTVNATSQAIWLAKVEADLQGRVSAVRRFIAQGAVPIAYVLVGPLSDRVFEPLMAEDGALAGSVGEIIGSGFGRGYGLFFIVIGLFVVVASVAAWMYPPLRHLERDIPDVVQEVESQKSETTSTEVPGV